jgi:hypothetical protein
VAESFQEVKMSKPPIAQVQEIQSWFYDFLKQKVDPYDFGRYIEEWASDTGVRLKDPDETTPHDLTPSQLKKFEKWIVDEEKGIDWLSTGDPFAPAYLFFDEVSKLPVGSWGIHFTEADAFDVFDRGTTLDALALSTAKRTKDKVDCSKNLTDKIGTGEVVFGFAFTADQKNVLSMGQKYGRNAALFQTDGAVRAWHVGDEEYQMIFPLCSEYNVIPMYGPRPGEITIGTEDGGEAVFQSLEDVIRYVKSGERKGVQANPSKRLVRVFEE